MTNSSKIRCDGTKIRQLRMRLGMTQEKLAIMSKVDARTVQRAENNGLLQLDSIACIAASLKVTISEIGSNGEAAQDGSGAETERNAVVLRRVTSGRILIDSICNSFSGALYCAAEPTAENIDLLSALVAKLESLLPDPWQSPMEAGSLSLAAQLREALAVTIQLAELEKFGIAVFAGTYTARAQIPRYDIDEGVMCTSRNQRFEPVMVCRISINPLGAERVTVKVTDEWVEPSPPAGRTTDKLEADDDIPF